MSEKTVVTTVENGVMVIRLDNLSMNNGTTYVEQNLINDAFEEAIGNPEVKVIVFTGTGKYFHTGGRVPQHATAEIKKAHTDSVSRSNRVMAMINKPLIAVVNGECSAGGMSILLNADMAVAVDTAEFGFSEALRGGFPAMIIPQVMDYIPKKKLLESCFTGNLFSAETAFTYGLLNYVVKEEDLWPTVNGLIEKITRMNPELLSIGRKYYYSLVPMDKESRVTRSREFLQEVLAIQTR
ncbi:MAG: enoyl-CoA hydratase/isomerase family protein [Spirochaetales bacterium]|nr:enoyl-CoA hydratase/isomerase family protein [Spirochaetales bacterium]